MGEEFKKIIIGKNVEYDDVFYLHIEGRHKEEKGILYREIRIQQNVTNKVTALEVFYKLNQKLINIKVNTID